jgi:cobalt-zinc-cadmium efflux system protein
MSFLDPVDRRARLAVAFAFTVGLFGVQGIAAIAANSLALFAEAFHVLIDAVALGIALGTVWLAARPPKDRWTFGLLRLEILATVVNVGLLLIVATVVVIEGLRRLTEPAPVNSALVLPVATAGLVVNLLALALLRDPGSSLVVRAAFLEVASDLIGAAAVIISALVAIGFRAPGADTVAAILVVGLIVPRAWSLLREALDVLLEATPRGVDIETVRRHVLECGGVKDVHDLHVWTITSGVNVLSAHVVLDRGTDASRVLDDLERCLRGDFDIEHSTFQLEGENRQPIERGTHE